MKFKEGICYFCKNPCPESFTGYICYKCAFEHNKKQREEKNKKKYGKSA